MGKKAILFIVIGVVLGVALAGGGIFFMLQNGGEKPVEVEPVIEEFDITQGHRLTLEKVQIPLAISSSKTNYLQADFTIVFKNAELLTKAEGLLPDIKDVIYGVFETKTANELKVQPNADGTIISPREAMKGPVLEAVRNVFFTEEEKDAVAAVVISSFIVQ